MKAYVVAVIGALVFLTGSGDDHGIGIPLTVQKNCTLSVTALLVVPPTGKPREGSLCLDCGDQALLQKRLQAGSDFVTGLCLLVLSLSLLNILRKVSLRRPFYVVSALFIVFLFLCGVLHLLIVALPGSSNSMASTGLSLLVAVSSCATVIGLLRYRATFAASLTSEPSPSSTNEQTSDLQEPHDLLRQQQEENKRLSRELAAKEELLQKSLQQLDFAPDAVVIVDAAGNIYSVNRQVEKVFGYNRQELLGKPVEILIPSRYHISHLTHRKQYADAPKVRGMGAAQDLYGLQKNGEEFPVEISLSPIRTQEGAYVAAAIRDVTDRKKAEQKFKDLLESAPDAIIIINSKGIIELTNRQTEKIFGYNREELIGQPIEIVIPDRFKTNHQSHRTGYFHSPKTRQMGSGLDLLGLRKNGEEFPVEISLSPLQTEDGTLISAAIRDVTDRKKAEQKFKDLLESAPDAIIIINSKGIIELTNRQTEKIFGYNREELLGKSVEMVIPERFRSAHQGHRTGYFHAPKTRQMGGGLDLLGVRKNGEEFPVEISLSPLQTEEGTLISASIRDVTDRKEAEKLMSQLAAVVEYSDDAIISKSTTGVIQSWNKGAERIFGYTADEVVGRNIKLLIPQQLHPEEEYILKTLTQGKVISQFETQRLNKQKELIDVSVTISPIFDKRGEVIGISKTVRDISAKKKAEIDLHEALKNVRDLYDNAPCGYLSVDATIYLSGINKTLLDWLGYERDEVIGKLKYEDLLSPESRNLFLASFEEDFEQYKTKGYVNNLEFEFQRKDGSTFPCVVNSMAIFNKQGEFVSSRTTVFDNTERKKAERKVLQLNKELEAFTYSVSHDLRAPLRSIDGYARILVEDYSDKLDNEAQAVLGTITKNTVRMGKLIDDLLELSRTGRVELSTAGINMKDLVEGILADVAPAYPHAHIELQELTPAKGDINLLRQVWINFISNALKYSARNPKAIVEIGSYRHESSTCYYVRDNGVGFDMQYYSKLFGVFQRLHRAQDFEGTGVGLAIVKRIIERHNGQVWAEGVLNKGSVFYFSLPD